MISQFPMRTQVGKDECTQEEGESVLQYYYRLKAVFDTHRGIPGPNPYDDAGAYAHQLKAAFLNGLNQPIAVFVKKHLVGWRTCDFAKVRDHAVHAQEVIKEGGRGRGRLRGRGSLGKELSRQKVRTRWLEGSPGSSPAPMTSR